MWLFSHPNNWWSLFLTSQLLASLAFASANRLRQKWWYASPEPRSPEAVCLSAHSLGMLTLRIILGYPFGERLSQPRLQTWQRVQSRSANLPTSLAADHICMSESHHTLVELPQRTNIYCGVPLTFGDGCYAALLWQGWLIHIWITMIRAIIFHLLLNIFASFEGAVN